MHMCPYMCMHMGMGMHMGMHMGMGMGMGVHISRVKVRRDRRGAAAHVHARCARRRAR